MAGYIEQKWWRVLAAKLLAHYLVSEWVSLGRGSEYTTRCNDGKGVCKADEARQTRKVGYDIGAGAGLAAHSMHVAGVCLPREYIKLFAEYSVVMASSVTADFISSNVFGLDLFLLLTSRT